MAWLVATVLTVVGAWTAVMFVDSMLRSRRNFTYIWLMERAGLSLKFGQIRWTTTRYNRIFAYLGSRKSKILHIWFNIGAIAGILLVLPSILILITTIKNNASYHSGDLKDEQILTTLLPGVNLPISEMPFYVITLVFCIIFHELGHALAAVGEEAKVLGCGLTVIGVLPAAFVDLSTEQMLSLHPWQQLKVFCAGIWHNVVLMFVAVLLLILLPFVFSIGYMYGSGVAIQHIQEWFPSSGLTAGDHIIAVNDCHVLDDNSWYDCLNKISDTPQMGFCVQDSYLESYSWNTTGIHFYMEHIECCPATDKKGLCFAWINPRSERQKIKSFACLPARRLLSQSNGLCFSEEECDMGFACIQPAIENSTRLVQVSRSGKENALYICPVADMYYSISVSNYVPKFKLLPNMVPYVVEMLLKYVVSFSGALGILNAIPCYALDGQWIALALVDMGLSRVLSSRKLRNVIFHTIVVLGTVLLGVTIVTGISNIL